MRVSRTRGAYVVLPVLRVRENGAGTLDAVPWSDLAPDQTSEGWWAAALRDRRLRAPRGRAFDHLGLGTSATIAIVCRECGLRREFTRAELLRLYGPQYWMTYLRYDLARCPKGRSFRDCGVRYADDLPGG